MIGDELIKHGPIALLLIFIGIVLGLSIWLIIAACQGTQIESTTLYPIHNSPDNYQYITIDNKPINITAKLGRSAPEDYVVKYTKEKTTYCGITEFKQITHMELVKPSPTQ